MQGAAGSSRKIRKRMLPMSAAVKVAAAAATGKRLTPFTETSRTIVYRIPTSKDAIGKAILVINIYNNRGDASMDIGANCARDGKVKSS